MGVCRFACRPALRCAGMAEIVENSTVGGCAHRFPRGDSESVPWLGGAMHDEPARAPDRTEARTRRRAFRGAAVAAGGALTATLALGRADLGDAAASDVRALNL